MRILWKLVFGNLKKRVVLLVASLVCAEGTEFLPFFFSLPVVLVLFVV